MRPSRRSVALTAPVALLLSACLFPEDTSDQITVQVDEVPTLFEEEQWIVAARALNEAGDSVPNVEIRFQIGDQAVAQIVDTVSVSEVLLRALEHGTTEVTASAVGFESALSASQAVRVLELLTVDSVRPRTVRLGDTVMIYGAGLDPDRLISVEFGNARALVKRYEQDPARRRFGTLTQWVLAPAPRGAPVQVTTQDGIIIADTILVAQRDLLEPDDTVPRALTFPFLHPALAWEVRGREDPRPAVDWFTIDLPQQSDITVFVTSPFFGARSGYVSFLSDSIYWDSNNGSHFLGSAAWLVGSSNQACGGVFSEDGVPYQNSADTAAMALQNMPAGRYHLWISYPTITNFPVPYAVRIDNSYRSVLSPDQFEENDLCDNAPSVASLVAAGSANFDNPLDVDWYSVDLSGGDRFLVLEAATAVDSADLDMYLMSLDSTGIKDFNWVSEFGGNGVLGGDVEWVAGYLRQFGEFSGDPLSGFLIVADFQGVPTTYTVGEVPWETEPNDDWSTYPNSTNADTVTLSQKFYDDSGFDDWYDVLVPGRVDAPQDIDTYVFWADAGTWVCLNMQALILDSRMEAAAVLWDDQGNQLAGDASNGFFDPFDCAQLTADGWYRVGLWDFNNFATAGGQGYHYLLQLEYSPPASGGASAADRVAAWQAAKDRAAALRASGASDAEVYEALRSERARAKARANPVNPDIELLRPAGGGR